MANGQDQDVVFTSRARAATAPAPVSTSNQDVTFTPRAGASTAVAPPSEDTSKTWGSVLGVPYKKSSFDPIHMASEAGTGLMELGQGLYHTAGDVLLPPGNTEGERLGYLGNKYVVQPWKAEQAKAQTALNQDPSHPIRNQIESAGHGLAADIPLIGPWASSLGEQAGTGDVGGAMAKGGAQMAAAEIAPKVVGKVAKIPSTVGNIYGGLKYIGELGNKMKEIGVEGGSDAAAPARPGAMADAVAAAKARQAGATIPQPGEIPATKPMSNAEIGRNVEKGVREAAGTPPLKPNVPLRDQLTPTPTPKAEAPAETPAETPKRTSAHHVYGDEVGDELRSKPDLQSYFNGKKGEGFTNVKARQVLLNAGHDMGQAVVNSKMLQGEGAITPGKAVEILRGKGYSMEQIRDLAEKPAK